MTKPTNGGKSPYEIRLELLQMAQSHLQSAFERQMQFATEALKLATDAQWKSIEQLKELMPKAYTIDDVLAKAAELYGFVQKRD
jgi:hypothetical protein